MAKYNRDVEELFKDYEPLRKVIWAKNKYKFLKEEGSFSYSHSQSGYTYNYADLDDLKSYIDTEFVRLVKEYDINGPIDFPGYISSKLTKRVIGTHMQRRARGIQHETPEGASTALVFDSIPDVGAEHVQIVREKDMDKAREYLLDEIKRNYSEIANSELHQCIAKVILRDETNNFAKVCHAVKELHPEASTLSIKSAFNLVTKALAQLY